MDCSRRAKGGLSGLFGRSVEARCCVPVPLIMGESVCYNLRDVGTGARRHGCHHTRYNRSTEMYFCARADPIERHLSARLVFIVNVAIRCCT